MELNKVTNYRLALLSMSETEKHCSEPTCERAHSTKLIEQAFVGRAGTIPENIYSKKNFDVLREDPFSRVYYSNSRRRAFARNVEILLIYFQVVASLPTKACSFDWHYLQAGSVLE